MSAKTNCKFEAIREKIKGFPTGPGLYFMKGPADKVLYIGKAKNLRSRVASYFHPAHRIGGVQPGGDILTSRGPKIVTKNRAEHGQLNYFPPPAQICNSFRR